METSDEKRRKEILKKAEREEIRHSEQMEFDESPSGIPPPRGKILPTVLQAITHAPKRPTQPPPPQRIGNLQPPRIVAAYPPCSHPSGHYDKNGKKICDRCGQVVGACSHPSGHYENGKKICDDCHQIIGTGKVVFAKPPSKFSVGWKNFASWSGTIGENVKSKTLELIAAVIAAVVLVYFGFIWAAVGVLFFMFHLYLPNEEDVMARAREQAGLKAAPAALMKMIRSMQIEINDAEEEMAMAEGSEKIQIFRQKKALERKLNDLIDQAQKKGVKADEIEKEINTVKKKS